MLTVLALVQAAAALLPELQSVLPTVETLLNGGTVTTEEEAALTAAVNAMNAQALAAAQGVDPGAA